MKKITLNNLLNSLKNEIIEIKNDKIDNFDIELDFLTDTRELSIKQSENKNKVFIAIKGNNFDGHNFVKEAILKGVKIAIISKDIIERLTTPYMLIKVKDTVKAYGEIAKFYLKQNKIKTIAITGSSGKTTTKDLISLFLSKRLNIKSAKKNFNNEIGVAKTILSVKKNIDYLILEFGARKKGDIKYLSEIALPELGIITNIGTAHIGIFKTQDNIFQTKSELLNFVKTAILNKDDNYFEKLKEKSKETISISLQKKADIEAKIIKLSNNNTYINLYIKDFKYTNFKLPFIGIHLIYDLLFAIATAYKLNILDVNLLKYINEFSLPPSRFNIKNLKNNIVLIDDCYNANYQSMSFAIDTASLIDKNNNRRKIAIIGDMLELGLYSKQLHENIARQLLNHKFSVIITYGNESIYIYKYLTEKLILNKNIIAKHFKDKLQINKFLYDIIKSNDIILVKGSRAMQLEDIVKFIEHIFK